MANFSLAKWEEKRIKYTGVQKFVYYTVLIVLQIKRTHMIMFYTSSVLLYVYDPIE